MPKNARTDSTCIFWVYKSLRGSKNNMNNEEYAAQAQAEKKFGLLDICPTMYLKMTG